MLIESIHIDKGAQRMCPKLPEIVYLTMNSIEGILAASKHESEVTAKLAALLYPYQDGGEFSVSFVDPMSKLPVDVMKTRVASIVLDYKVKVH